MSENPVPEEFIIHLTKLLRYTPGIMVSPDIKRKKLDVANKIFLKEQEFFSDLFIKNFYPLDVIGFADLGSLFSPCRGFVFTPEFIIGNTGLLGEKGFGFHFTYDAFFEYNFIPHRNKNIFKNIGFSVKVVKGFDDDAVNEGEILIDQLDFGECVQTIDLLDDIKKLASKYIKPEQSKHLRTEQWSGGQILIDGIWSG